MVAFILVLATLVAAFAVLGLQSRSDSRRQAEQRFRGEAALTARLTSALLNTSVAGSEREAAQKLSSASVSSETLDRLARASKLAYLLVLDGRGRVLGASSGAAAAARASAIRPQGHIKEALAGVAALSNVLDPTGTSRGRVVEWALPFQSSSGKRVEVEAFDPTLLSGFFSAYLAQAAESGGGAAFILDEHGRVLGDGSGTIAPGGVPKSSALRAAVTKASSGTFRYDGVKRYFAAAPVPGSQWRVVMTVGTNTLYPAVAGSESWFLYAVLAALAVAGSAGILFFRRALLAGVALRQTNEELRTLNVTLEERVAERTAAAEERARDLARSNAELEQFSSIASHDLQEPLRKIRMFGDRLRERLGPDLDPEPASDLNRIQNAASRMQRLINDLLDFSRVSHRGNAFEPVELGDVVQEVLADLEARIIELDARVEVSDLPLIDADRTQMRQLIQNLVGNALKFHREGVAPVVRISGAVAPDDWSKSAGESRPKARAVMTIADNGIGFEQKHAERVFDAFERLHSVAAYDGTGIGLSIVRKIAWRHGGHVSATGALGEGATFTISLPLKHAEGDEMNGDGGAA